MREDLERQQIIPEKSSTPMPSDSGQAVSEGLDKGVTSDLKKAWEKVFFGGQEISEEIRKEILERIKVTQVNGVWVCFYPDEVTDAGVEVRMQRAKKQTKILRSLVENSSTEGVVVEYFSPELKHNARISSLLSKLFIKINLSTPRDRERVFGFNYLARLATEFNKPIYVADIANKPAYHALRTAWGYAPGAVVGLASSRPESAVSLAMNSLAGGFASAVVQETISRATREKNLLENVVLTPEDARRVFIAKGIREITQRIKNSQGGPVTLLVVYPEAHISRILNYLDSENPKKEGAYKFTLPGLNFAVRKYARASAHGSKSRELSGWQLVEEMLL